MSELRKDPVTGRWVILSAERAKRPHDFAGEAREPEDGRNCPFCEGNESKTPPEIFAVRDPDSRADKPGWRVRVVPNLYPALRVEGDLEKRGQGIYDRMNGVGAHEVFVEGPRHETTPITLPSGIALDAVTAYRERMRDLRRDPRLAYGLVFKNVGRRAGASLAHNHSQLIATPVVPIQVQVEIEGARRFYDYRGRCIYCDMVHQEMAEKDRIVEVGDGFVAFAPYAPRFPYETWILPRRHQSHFETIADADLAGFAGVFASVLRRLEERLDRPAYNTMLHTSPWTSESLEHFHWHLEIIPRLIWTAGFEWGSGFYINPVPPETAAAVLAGRGA